MTDDERRKLGALAVFLRIYGILSLIIFGSLFVGFAVQTPPLAEGGCAELDDLERHPVRQRAMSRASYALHYLPCLGCVLLPGSS